MTKLEELHKVKDQAMRALEKRNFERAAELYLEVASREPDPDWRQRAGDAYRRAGNAARAVEVLHEAAAAYAHAGFLLKAIAVSKTQLQLDPQNTSTQAFLADLYARREAGTARPIASAADRPMPAPLRPPGAAVFAPAAPPPPVQTPTLSQRSSSGIRAFGPEPVTAPIDLFGSETDHSQPIEILPLSQVLGGRRSSDPGAGFEAQPATFEIMLDDADVLLDDADIRVADDVIESELPAPPVIAAVPTAPQDEIDWSDLSDEAVPKSESGPIVLAHEVPPANVPRIPLFSSLATADLLLVIQRMALHELEPGHVVVREGDVGGSLYVIVDGEVAVTVGQGGASRELARLAPGAFFGELGLLTDDPRSATVTVTQPTRLLEISRELAWEVIERAPEILRTLLRFCRDRMLDRLVDVSPLFGGLPHAEAAKLASQFVFLELEPGVVPIQTGARSAGLYFVMCGAAEVVRDGKRLGVLGPGDVFGEMSMLLRTPAMADVRTLRKTWVLQLPQAQFQEVMMTYPQVLAYVSELGDRRSQPEPIESETSFASIDMGDSRRIEIA